ncbi:MAG: hypothetical protein KDB07_05570, partial [Planctomycetes bacterium]|nr:hypothetical protein [Planctomycetota bacterium]
MISRRTRLSAFSLSVGQSLLGMISILLLARFEGASSAYALFGQASALVAFSTALIGVEAGRQHMVHLRLNKKADEAWTLVQNLFSLLVVARIALSALLILAPASLLALLTNIDANEIDVNRGVMTLLGFEFLAQVLLDVALFTALTRGWLIAGPATAFVIYALRLAGIVILSNHALEGALVGMIVGDLLGAAYILFRLFGRQEIAFLKPTLAPKRLVAALRMALPTSVLGFFAGFIIWSRNYAVAEVADAKTVALFNYINPLLMSVGLVFAIMLNTGEAILVSDRERPLEARKAMVLKGFTSGLAWALGS